MNLHGYLAREHIFYGSEEGVDFTNMYFYTVLYLALRASNRIAIERGTHFKGFERSKYASGEFFAPFLDLPNRTYNARFVLDDRRRSDSFRVEASEEPVQIVMPK